MTTLSLLDWTGVFAVSIGAAGVALWLSGLLSSSIAFRRRSATESPAQDLRNHFLFEDDILVDHDTAGLPPDFSVPDTVTDWAALRGWLSRRFAGLPARLSDLPEGFRQEISSFGADPASRVAFHHHGRVTRLTLVDTAPHHAAKWHAAMISLDSARHAEVILASVPDPIWRTDPAGAVVWQNAACDRIRDKAGNLPVQVAARATDRSTVCIEADSTGDARWFELRTAADGRHLLHFASDITRTIRAETVQREFVQTLTKTFANLTIGLAIFDRSRQLALFNPALVDLTGVPVGFLSARPDLMHFFDQLRERQVMPEPRSYANWRSHIRDIVAQAKDGLYQEMWTLPNSLTYRVTGRPHPDGAVAFLFEDISAEISLTRRFRTQVEIRQSVLDGIDDAIAVIGSNNVVMFCNAACRNLLHVDPDSSFADMTLRDLQNICEARFGESADWRSFSESLVTRRGHMRTQTQIRLAAGADLKCQMRPLPGGVRMLVFSSSGAACRQTALGATP